MCINLSCQTGMNNLCLFITLKKIHLEHANWCLGPTPRFLGIKSSKALTLEQCNVYYESKVIGNIFTLTARGSSTDVRF